MCIGGTPPPPLERLERCPADGSRRSDQVGHGSPAMDITFISCEKAVRICRTRAVTSAVCIAAVASLSLSSRTLKNRSVQRTHACLHYNGKKKNTKNSDSGSCCRQNFFLSFFLFSLSKKTRDILGGIRRGLQQEHTKKNPAQKTLPAINRGRGGKLRQLGDDGWGRRAGRRRAPIAAGSRRRLDPALGASRYSG